MADPDDLMPKHFELVGGPLDGGRVSTSTMTAGVPHAIYVGPKWLGDGFVAFTRDDPCERFPMLYVFEGAAYCFRGRRWNIGSQGGPRP